MSQIETLPIKYCFFCQDPIGARGIVGDQAHKIAACLHDDYEILHVFNNSGKVTDISIVHITLPFACHISFANQQYFFSMLSSYKVLCQEPLPNTLTFKIIQQQFQRLAKLLPFL